jgi:hypothetical protein
MFILCINYVSRVAHSLNYCTRIVKEYSLKLCIPGFLACDARGPTGYIFADCGARFVIRDKTGENPVTRIITNISNAEEGVVTLLGAFEEEGGRMHGIQDDDHEGWVEISDVEGKGVRYTVGEFPFSLHGLILWCQKCRLHTFQLQLGHAQAERVCNGVYWQGW